MTNLGQEQQGSVINQRGNCCQATEQGQEVKTKWSGKLAASSFFHSPLMLLEKWKSRYFLKSYTIWHSSPSHSCHVLVASLLFSQKLQLHTVGCVYPFLHFSFSLLLFPSTAHVLGSTIAPCVCHYTVRKTVIATYTDRHNIYVRK